MISNGKLFILFHLDNRLDNLEICRYIFQIHIFIVPHLLSMEIKIFLCHNSKFNSFNFLSIYKHIFMKDLLQSTQTFADRIHVLYIVFSHWTCFNSFTSSTFDLRVWNTRSLKSKLRGEGLTISFFNLGLNLFIKQKH